MNRGRKLKHMQKFINKYGVITTERKVAPNKAYPPYRKGSYFIAFDSERLGLCVACGDVDRYRAYKGVVEEIKYHNKE